MTKENLDIAYFISFCIEQYKNEKGISGSEAMKILYSSELYARLENESTKAWHLGPVALYQDFKAEI